MFCLLSQNIQFCWPWNSHKKCWHTRICGLQKLKMPQFYSGNWVVWIHLISAWSTRTCIVKRQTEKWLPRSFSWSVKPEALKQPGGAGGSAAQWKSGINIHKQQQWQCEIKTEFFDSNYTKMSQIIWQCLIAPHVTPLMSVRITCWKKSAKSIIVSAE